MNSASVSILIGDCRLALRSLPDESVQAVVTSPPYWGLRDYESITWKGGARNCDHQNAQIYRQESTGSAQKDKLKNKRVCSCGAVGDDLSIGGEYSPEEYVNQLCNVFDEIWRVLRQDGTVWLNLGDTYAPKNIKDPRNGVVIKRKNLLGMPWRVALALQSRGWILRQDIIWSKPNAMPENIKDRFTNSHEHVFMLSKSQKYFFDINSVKEEAVTTGKRFPNAERRALGIPSRYGAKGAAYYGISGFGVDESGKRIKRDVWNVSTKPFKGAHFALYPPELIETCVLAATKEGDFVLDPFSGAGTTGLVSLNLKRNYIGIEISKKYANLSKKRIEAEVKNAEVAVFSSICPSQVELLFNPIGC